MDGGGEGRVRCRLSRVAETNLSRKVVQAAGDLTGPMEEAVVVWPGSR